MNEFISGGSLAFHLDQNKKFPENQAKFYLAEILLGLLYLHKERLTE